MSTPEKPGEPFNPYQAPPGSSYGVPDPADWGSGGREPMSFRTFEALRQTRPWVIFVGVVGFIVGGLTLIGALFALVMVLGQQQPMGVIMAGVYVLQAILYLVPSFLLVQYGNRIGQFMQTRAAPELDAAMEAQKSFWRVMGIIVLLGVVLCCVLLPAFWFFVPSF